MASGAQVAKSSASAFIGSTGGVVLRAQGLASLWKDGSTLTRSAV
jgi:hypothetical protein